MDKDICPFCGKRTDWIGSNYSTDVEDGIEILIENEVRYCGHCDRDYEWVHRYRELDCKLKE